jgi:hypothetical protein
VSRKIAVDETVMICRTLGTFLWAIALSCSGLTADSHASRIYTFVNYPDEQSGHTLSGQIVTSDTAPDDGVLVASEILSWEYMIEGPSPLVATSADYDLDATFIKGTVFISATEISLAAPAANVAIENSLELRRITNVGTTRPNHSLFWGRLSQPVPAERYQARSFSDASTFSGAWADFAPASLGPGDWVLATRAIPEPGTWMLLSLAALGVTGLNRTR